MTQNQGPTPEEAISELDKMVGNMKQEVRKARRAWAILNWAVTILLLTAAPVAVGFIAIGSIRYLMSWRWTGNPNPWWSIVQLIVGLWLVGFPFMIASVLGYVATVALIRITRETAKD